MSHAIAPKCTLGLKLYLPTKTEALLTRQRGQDLLPGRGVEGDDLRDTDILAQEGRPGGRKSLSEQRRARKRSHCSGLNGGKDEEVQLAQG